MSVKPVCSCSDFIFQFETALTSEIKTNLIYNNTKPAGDEGHMVFPVTKMLSGAMPFSMRGEGKYFINNPV